MEITGKIVDTVRAMDPTRPLQGDGDNGWGKHLDIINIHYPEGVAGTIRLQYPNASMIIPNDFEWLSPKGGKGWNTDFQWDRPLFLGEFGMGLSNDNYSSVVGDEYYTWSKWETREMAERNDGIYQNSIENPFMEYLKMRIVHLRNAGVAGLNPWAGYFPHVLAMKQVAPLNYHANVSGGGTLKRKIAVFNDTTESKPIHKIRWYLCLGSDILHRGVRNINLGEGGKWSGTLEIPVPETAKPLKARLIVRALWLRGKVEVEQSRFEEEINIFPKITDAFVKQICEIIRQFRRLTVTPGFMYDNFKYIIEWDETGLKHKSSYVSDVYNYYIEKQYEICLDRLGYNFVKYAPAMAYLFSYKGYTYERFKLLREDHTLNRNHPLNQICKHFDKIYHTFLFIKKHKDAREYLIALHYNRELRYYVEYPTESIDPNSILYEFMTRNIAVMIRKLWTDTNKFIIACEILLQRDELPACMQSMLVYCLAHLRMYDPIRDRLRKQLQDYGKNFLSKKDCNNWIVNKVDSVDKLNQFITLSLKHSMETFRLIDSNNSIELVNMLLKDEDFRNYNRQFQMLYYEDLSIKGEESRHALNPATDIVYKGFDFHNCFYYLYVKLSSSWEYPLRDFDMFTLWDLIYSRLLKKFLEGFRSETEMKTFFYREKFDDRAKEVLIHTLNIFTNYLNTHKAESSSSVYSFFEKVQNVLQRIILIRENEFNSYQLIMKTLDDINYNKFK